jgi:hypothetical protein
MPCPARCAIAPRCEIRDGWSPFSGSSMRIRGVGCRYGSAANASQYSMPSLSRSAPTLRPSRSSTPSTLVVRDALVSWIDLVVGNSTVNRLLISRNTRSRLDKNAHTPRRGRVLAQSIPARCLPESGSSAAASHRGRGGGASRRRWLLSASGLQPAALGAASPDAGGAGGRSSSTSPVRFRRCSSSVAKSRLIDASTVPEARSVAAAGSRNAQRAGWPRAASRSAIAWAGSPTLIVVMPIARAGLRLMPRSSRNTHCSGGTPTTSQARA